jgi:hypothetical protein
MSIDDITTDEACTFIATKITPWHGQGTVISTITTQAGLGTNIGGPK